MALTNKKYNSLHGKTGSDKNSMKAKFDEGHQHVYVDDPDGGDPAVVAMIYQIGQLEEELDYLRTEISSNKDKTGISSSQASAITANTAKVSMVIGTGKGEAMSGQTNLVTVGTQAHQAMAGNTTIPPISITGLPANHTFDVQVRVMPPAKGAKKGTVVLTWAITDVPNRVVYSSNQTLI
ncbi:hypothetical protein [uncultured virus]|uniref:Uncharacterized protein n=1 Tax=uncultured virus TaxID=340016 RepID=A0A218MLR1_9VIRU|nr:hypothetical protein [uncultured virus]